jgi:formamidopyrimidine-DNA glycosylase
VPELPDVETYRRRLAEAGMHRLIERVRLTDRAALRGVSVSRFTAALQGKALVDTGRRGKHLFAATSDGATLVLHFGMTGRLEVDRPPDPPGQHERLALLLEDGGTVTVIDPRRLGFITVVDDRDEYCREHDLGPDALTVGLGDLRRLLRTYRGGVKSLLMNQSRVAGIGNIYSDEILFQARIDPRRTAASLDDGEVRRLHRQMLRVLRLAADRGADPTRLPRGWLLPHREDGGACPRGNGEIEKIHLVGRGCYWCPACQS